MVDSSDGKTAWAEQWIAQQRALLEQLSVTERAANDAAAADGVATGAAAKDAAAAGTADAQSKSWSDLGIAWLRGIAQSLQPAGQGGAGTFPPAASEAFETWRAAWSTSLANAAAPGGWSDMVNRTPPLGLFREQTEAWRAVAAAQADCQRLEQEFAAVMRRVQADALNLLEQRIQGRHEQGSPVQGFRELYDLWVECSEEVFRTVAHSPAYGHLQGEIGNATLRLRARIQKVIEQGLRQFDLPTRSEINSVHQQLRQLRQQLGELQQAAAADSAASTRPTAARKPAATRDAADKASRSGTKAAAAARTQSTPRKQSTRASRRSR